MTDYTKLVKALRYCGNFTEREGCTESCEYFNDIDCPNRIMSDAAAGIEELQQIADHYEQTAKDYWKEACEYKAQLPKRGKWIGVNPMVDTVQCSICGGQLFSAELETPYCPYCGAKMEVQE